jgi:very-short-patch-repair endonuclease/DNA polymerase III delta prime subunit
MSVPNDHQSAGPPSPERVAAVKSAAGVWSSQLIDLGGRNTLLYYRDLKVGTLDLTDASPVGLALLLDGRAVRLSNLFPAERVVDAARRARTVAAKAKENFEERGLSTLYAARGMATWTAEATTTATPAAPVLLAQLSLRSLGALENDFDLTLIDEWEANPTLLHMLSSTFQVDVDEDELTDAVERSKRPEAAGELLAKRASRVPGFSVSNRTVVGNFSYVKQPMVIDLESALDVMFGNELIAALAGDRDAITALRSASVGVTPDQPDHTPPADEFLAIDADSSQHYVINAAVDGTHLVVQGPPGTGKSQTIANLIATLASRGRSVLFVAEKRAAIDAVVNRLDRVGLKDLVLDLHGGGGSRRKMAEELRRVYDGTATVPAVVREGDDARLVERRTRLNQHAAALHIPREPWNVTVYGLQAELISVPEHLRVSIRLDSRYLHALTGPAIQAVADAMSDWVTTGGPAVAHRTTPWARAAARITTSSDAQAALTAARILSTDTMPVAMTQLDLAVAACGLRRPLSVASWAGLLSLLQRVAEVGELAEPTIWDLDLAELQEDVGPAGGGAIRRAAAAVFNSRYRAAKKAVAAVLRQPRKGAELHSLVSTARSTREEWSQTSVDGLRPRLPGNLDGTAGAYQRLTTELAGLGAYIGTSVLLDSAPEETSRSLDALLSDQNTLFKLPKLHELESSIDSAGLATVRALVLDRNLDAGSARTMVEYVWRASILERVSLTDSDIGAFDGTTHNKYVAEFTVADRSQIVAGAAKVRRAVAENLVTVRNSRKEQDALVASEVRKKTRHRTLRELTQMAPEVLLALKPCWAMSPLAVSQLLDAKQLFDVVVFDEASQVPPADAVPSLMRARQAIVAGDAKQLPPTAFFASATLEDDSEAEVNGLLGTLTTGTESILDAMASVVTAGSMTLRWHYRSRDERLIAFSNAQPLLYDWQMVTFPGAAGHDAIRHVYVPWHASAGASDDSSAAEVTRVVELIADHAHTDPEMSLGVIAMGIKHADRIAEGLRRARHDDPVLNRYCESHPNELPFVKNLERVQGDERDAIILTIGYGKGSDGRMQYRFGPINNAGGERRLNVAITRARSQMTVVSSFLPTDLDPGRLKSEGAQMLGRYITYAASGGADLGQAHRHHPPLNHFETDVRDRLSAAGVALLPQLGVSGYFIDFAAAHPSRPGEFVLAIEADGASYHASATARERDRLRQEHLERLGWRFHRIWSTEWFRNPEAETARAVAAWQAACALSDLAANDAGTSRPQPSAWAPPAISTTPSTSPVPSSARRAMPKPTIFRNETIDVYTDASLVAIVAWVASDGLLRTDTELLAIAMSEMGYQRRGSKIVDRLERAIAQHHRRR